MTYNQESSKIKNMFSGISGKYDAANEVLSLGLYNKWYKELIEISKVGDNNIVLDCATGTGNLALKIKSSFPNSHIIGVDFTREMLDIAKIKSHELGLGIDFIEADVLNLPFADDSFDFSTICFGIRNTENPYLCLKEMARVTKKSGKVIVLEFGNPNGLSSILYNSYRRWIMPIIGGIVTGNYKAYKYLSVTSKEFPNGDSFIELMKATGDFSETYMKKLTFGVSFIYIGMVTK